MTIKFRLIGSSKRTAVLGGAIIVVFLLLFAWSKLRYPHSYAEAIFLSNLITKSSNNTEQIDLGELMPTKWETVCESHGYDKPIYLPKYRKTFPTVGAMQDGAWGLIFIKADGTFAQAASSCGTGMYLEFRGDRCLSRSEAIFFREKHHEYSKCKVVFAAKLN